MPYFHMKLMQILKDGIPTATLRSQDNFTPTPDLPRYNKRQSEAEEEPSEKLLNNGNQLTTTEESFGTDIREHDHHRKTLGKT